MGSSYHLAYNPRHHGYGLRCVHPRSSLSITLTNLIIVAGCIFVYITTAAPCKRSLGATNGLSQTTVSIARAIGPALSTSLFSISVEKNILGGYGVYAILIVFSVLALILGSKLPEKPWEDKEEVPEYDDGQDA